MRRLLSRLRDDRGVTLVELIWVMVFLGMISVAFSMLLTSSVRHEGDLREQSLTQDEMRASVDRLIRDVRSAYSATTWPIETAGTSQLTFTVPDRASSPVEKRVSYRVSGGTLQRAIGLASAGTPSNWQVIARNVSSATPFTYRDINDNATTLPAQVRTVNVTLTFATKTGKGRSYTYTSSGSPRMSP